MTSKDWTLDDVLGYLRVLTNQTSTDKVQSNFVIDFLHTSLSEVMQYLSVVKMFDYGIKTTLAVSVSGAYGTGSLAGFTTNPVNKIVKIIDPSQVTGKKLCIEVTQEQFDNLKNIIQNRSGTIFWARNGNNINFYSGDLTIGATLDFWYVAYPKKITIGTDYLEVKDPFIGLVLAKTKLKIYEMINSKPPDTINLAVNAQILEMRNAGLTDLTNKNKQGR